MHRSTSRAFGLLVPSTALLLLGAACGLDQPAGEPAEAAIEDGPLALTTADGLAAVDARTGAVSFEAPGAVASPDGSVIARSVVRPDSTTRVFWLDPDTGQQTARVSIDEPASIRVVTADGRVALGPPDVPPGGLVYPVPRMETSLTVAAPDGTSRTYELDGNIEPEAFSTDGRSLFVLGYTPAASPREYQVNRMDLETGDINGVFGQDSQDERQERMGGTARTQVWAPDASAVYTLYTQVIAGVATSFIHVLNLEEGWASCLDLPEAIGWDAPAALAISPDGGRLWATDASGQAVSVDTEAQEVLDSGRFESPGANGLAAVADGERLYLGSGDRIAVLDGEDLSGVADWRTTRTIIALRIDWADERVVAVTDGQLTTFPLRSPEQAPAGRDLPFTEPIVVTGPALTTAECAC